jgi:YD repeat-containing protein
MLLDTTSTTDLGYVMTYDNEDKLTSVTTSEPDGASVGVTASGSTSFTYDEAGQLLTLNDPESNTTTWAYDNLGQVTMETNVTIMGGGKINIQATDQNGQPATTDEVQVVTLSNATDGTFRLAFMGQTTAPITGNASGPWTITFAGTHADTNVQQILRTKSTFWQAGSLPYGQNPSPGPVSTAVPTVPSVMSNIGGNFSRQATFPAGQYCRLFPSMAAIVGMRAAMLAEWRNE